MEFHLIEFPEQVVREFQVRLVDLVDEEDAFFLVTERFSQFAEMDIFFDVVHAGLAELAVIKALDRIVNVQSVLGPGGRLDIPDVQLQPEAVRNGSCQHGLPRAGFALDQQRFLQRRRDIHGPDQFF